MAAVLLVAALTVHLPFGFTSIKLLAITSSGPQFGPPGYETDLLYLACLAALVMGGAGPWAADTEIARWLRRTPKKSGGQRPTRVAVRRPGSTLSRCAPQPEEQIGEVILAIGERACRRAHEEGGMHARSPVRKISCRLVCRGSRYQIGEQRPKQACRAHPTSVRSVMARGEFPVEQWPVLLAAEDVGVARASARYRAFDGELDCHRGIECHVIRDPVGRDPEDAADRFADSALLRRTASYSARVAKITSNVIRSTPAFLLRIVFARSNSRRVVIRLPPPCRCGTAPSDRPRASCG